MDKSQSRFGSSIKLLQQVNRYPEFVNKGRGYLIKGLHTKLTFQD